MFCSKPYCLEHHHKNVKSIGTNVLTDSAMRLKLEAFGAALIVGPKGCGKTTTAKHFANSYIEFQDEDTRERILSVAETMTSKLLIGEKPTAFSNLQTHQNSHCYVIPTRFPH